MFNYNIVLLDMPYAIKGTTTKDENDFYTIFINAKLCDEQQMEAFLHEIQHIKSNDCCNDICFVEDLESRCQERTKA